VAPYAFSQNIKITGTIFDPNGAVVTSSQIRAVDQKGHSFVGASDTEGCFEITLIPGMYSLEVSAPAFLTIKHPEFLVVNSTTGKMTMDFVVFGGKSHEPCGYSGADCLPAKSLIQSYEVKYSPKLKDIVEEFGPVPKSPEK
jgi:hypothetical protein